MRRLRNPRTGRPILRRGSTHEPLARQADPGRGGQDPAEARRWWFQHRREGARAGAIPQGPAEGDRDPDAEAEFNQRRPGGRLNIATEPTEVLPVPQEFERE